MLSQGQVINVGTNKQADGANPVAGLGPSGEQLASEVHGKFYNINVRNGLFTANASGVTIPVITATVASVFTLYNPRNSGVNLELVDADLTTVLATTVVNTYGLYFSADKNADSSTFTTEGTVRPGLLDGSTANAKGRFFTALTHVSTPALWRILGGHHAVTSTQVGGIHVDFDGKAIVKPGVMVSVIASTAASFTAGMAVGVTWAEFPV